MDGLCIGDACREPGVAARPALLARGAELSFGELAARVASFRAALSSRRVGFGSRVALVASNRVDTVVAILTLIELGAVMVPIHPRLTPPEVRPLLDDAAPDLVLSDADLEGAQAWAGAARERATSAVAHCPPLSPEAGGKGPGDRGVRGEDRDEIVPPPAPGPDSPLAILYTSGTTGRAKGAVLLRSAFVAAAEASAENLGWEADDRWLLALPLCHVGGLSIVTRCLLARRTVVLEPRFDPADVLRVLVEQRCTLLSVVPTMLRALLEQPDPTPLRRVRVVLVGGAATPPSLLAECARLGVRALTTYGLTEACSQVTAQRPPGPHPARAGSGQTLACASLRVAGEGDERLGTSQIGRILVRGPSLMAGYWRGPSRPLDRPFSSGGWFDTGDLGSLDEAGGLHVHARRTDLIVTGGENVYPAEIEQALEGVAGVRRALVFGVPDERWGQIVAAAIELGEPPAGDGAGAEAARWDLLFRSLAPHKRPRRACVVCALPLTSSGKVDRSSAVTRFQGLLREWGGGSPRG